MTWAWFKAIILLPFNVLVLAPALILWLSGYSWHSNHPLFLALGGILLLAGLFLAGWTMLLFNRLGQGTAAPWDPPRRLVVAGPYRHVRNPMICSVLVILAAEALLLNTVLLLAWGAGFFLGNMLYFPLKEEKELERRFGASYQSYKRHVPRWLPRLRPWQGEP
jgi:protein-S-isoprenylcysteine O-methyltransferase Ste14